MQKSDKDLWEKVRIIIGALSGIVLPIVIGIVGFKIEASFKNNELGAEYVKLATEILRTTDSSATDESTRGWAIALLKNYSPMPISPDLEMSLGKMNIQGPSVYFAPMDTAKPLRGYLVIKSEGQESAYVYIDGQISAKTPVDIFVPVGERVIKWVDKNGEELCQTTVSVSDTSIIGLVCNPKSGTVNVHPNLREKGRAWRYFTR